MPLQQRQPPAGAAGQAESGLPAEKSADVFLLTGFKGVNTKSPRMSIDDQELAWSENFLGLGEGNFRTLYDVGASMVLGSAVNPIVHMYFYSINLQEPSVNNPTIRAQYAILFFANGTATQVDTASGVTVVVSATSGKFIRPATATGSVTVLPDVAQFAQSGILIVCTQGYFAWDGTTLYGAGNVAPTWLTNGVAAQTMPSISGQSIEVYKQRVWISNGKTISFSAPLDGTKFATQGGGSFATTDSFLKSFVTALRQANGFLYAVGDSSVSVISNVQTAGTPAVTTFNYDSVDQVVGTTWRDTIRPFGRSLVFANSTGVYALSGGSVEKVSNNLDDVFRRANFTDPVPYAALATVFSLRLYVLLLTSFDPITLTNRTFTFLWDGEHWFPATQSNDMNILGTQKIDSDLDAWSTDGTNLFQTFQTPTSALTKRLRTKLFRTKLQDIMFNQALRMFGSNQDQDGGGVSLTFTCDNEGGASSPQTATANAFIQWINAGGSEIWFTNSGGARIDFGVTGTVFAQSNVNQYGRSLGLTVTTTSPDFSMIDLGLLIQEWAPNA